MSGQLLKNSRKQGAKSPVSTDEERVKKSLRASTSEGMFNSASTSILSTFIIPLALFFRATNIEIGLLSAVQNFANTFAQIPGAKLTEYYTRKGIWLTSQVLGKILLWIPIVFLPFIGFGNPVLVLIIIAGLVAFFVGIRSPAWSSLMGDLVPIRKRGEYFGMRNALTGLAGVIATVVAGFAVAVYGFSLIFAAAILLSFISIFFFMQMYEPGIKKIFHYKHAISFDPRCWASSIRLNRGLVMFTMYLFFMYFAVEVASPFYTVYMLRDLDISYAWFGILTTLGALVRIFSFRYWGRLNDRFGSRKILVVTGFFGCFTPFLWLFVSGVHQIAAVKVFDGFIWAGFDLVVFNYLLDITPSKKRPQYVANHNFFAGIGIISGALFGGMLAQSFQSGSFLWLQGLQIVFLVSFLLRICSLAILPKIREIEVKQTDLVPLRYVFWHSMAVEPAHGLRSKIFYTFRYPEKVRKELESGVKKIEYKIKIKKN